MNEAQKEILCDAQTSGGLLVFVKKASLDEFMKVAKENNLFLEPIGKTMAKGNFLVEVL